MHKGGEWPANLTGGGADGERRRTGGATASSGGGDGAPPGCLHDEGGGDLRAGIGRREVGDAPRERNRREAHRR